MERLVVPTDPEREKTLGRIALWLDADDLRWLMRHCCCAPDATEEQKERCMRLRFRAGAALHKAGVSQEPTDSLGHEDAEGKPS
jgi:hypothetical protein